MPSGALNWIGAGPVVFGMNRRAALDWNLQVDVGGVLQDVQSIKQNSVVMLEIEVKNLGSDSSPASQTLDVKCMVVSGGPR